MALFRRKPTSAPPPTSSEASFDSIYREHAPWLLRQVQRRFGYDQAEDIVQEAFANATAYEGKDVLHPRALLLQIAIRVAIGFERKRRVRPPLHDVTYETASYAEHQAEALVLKQLIRGLPPRLRDVFVLSRFAGLTYEEIAAQCGISVKTVESRMTKALKILTRGLKP